MAGETHRVDEVIIREVVEIEVMVTQGGERHSQLEGLCGSMIGPIVMPSQESVRPRHLML